MILALQSGVAAELWLDHPRALVTALLVLDEQRRRRGR